jgi:hypothetical protein
MPLAGDCIPPQKITTASLRGLWVPNWESGQVANAGCSQLTDWSGNGFHLTQATGSLQPLFKQDTTYKGKWYIKFDGVDDLMTCASDPLSTNAGQIMMICRFPNLFGVGIFGTTKLTLGASSGTNVRIDTTASGNGGARSYASSAAIINGASGYTNQYTCIFGRKPSSGNVLLTFNGVESSVASGVGMTLETSGISLGRTANVAATYWSGEIAAIALFEGTNLTTNDLTGLLNWSHREFDVYRDLLSEKI